MKGLKFFANFLNFGDSKKFLTNLEMAERFENNDVKRHNEIRQAVLYKWSESLGKSNVKRKFNK